MIIQIVSLRSTLTDAEVVELMAERSSDFAKVPGLLQKYYGRTPEGEYVGIYFFDSEESLDNYRESDLSTSIAAAYSVEGDVSRQLFEFVQALHPDERLDPAASR
jgi:heme-degrading monooxygenase HmoA